MSFKVVVHKDPLRFDTTDLLIVEYGSTPGERVFYGPMETFKPASRHAEIPPTLRIEDERMDALLQAIVDAAWERGLRPREIADQRSQVTAMTDHLNDLRRIAFKTLKIGDD